MRGKSNQQDHDYLYWEFHERSGARAARFKNWKAVQKNLKKDPNPPIEIYNLLQDPSELKDLSMEREDLIKKAKQIFVEAHSPSPIWKMPWEK